MPLFLKSNKNGSDIGVGESRVGGLRNLDLLKFSIPEEMPPIGKSATPWLLYCYVELPVGGFRNVDLLPP